jgi:hypothetical protein
MDDHCNIIDYVDDDNDNEEVVVILSLKQIIQRIIRLPAFMCLVAQGYVIRILLPVLCTA